MKKRHPEALGKSTRLILASSWGHMGPMLEGVLAGGESTWNERALFVTDRNGFSEEAWFTWSFIPIRSADGAVEGIFISAVEETVHVLRERELVETRDRLATTLAAGEIGTWSLDVPGGRVTADAHVARLFAMVPETVLAGLPVETFTAVIHGDDRERTLTAMTAALESGTHYEVECRLTPQGGLTRWVIARGRVARDGAGRALNLEGVLIDITARKRSEQIVALQNDVLRLIASQTSLPIILEALVRHVEALSEGRTVASIQLIDAKGRLRHGAAPSLPDSYNQAVNGIMTGEHVCTCGRAAFLREVVVTPDVAADPNWSRLRERAAALGLRAAWSAPIISTEGKVLGTFATYLREWREPSAEEKSAVDFLSKTAAIAIERAQAEDVLRESEARFRTLADNISQLAWMADGAGAIFWYNQRWFDYTGTTLETMRGCGWQNVHHPDYVKAATEKFVIHIRDGLTWEDTFPLRGAEGGYRWFLSRAFPTRNSKGEVVRWFGTNTDITTLREAQEELRERDERFRQIADTMPQIAWGSGADGVLNYYNRRWFEYIGLPETDTTGAQWDKHVHPEDLPLTHETWGAALKSGNGYQTEFRVRGADSNYRWFLTRALPVRDAKGEIVRWFGTCTDINDRKAIHDESLRMIERERAARVVSENAGRMKDDFLATLSHELRTPLNPVLLLASEGAANSALPDDVRADFNTIAKNVALEARLIDDLLDLTRLTRGKMALSVAPADVHSVLVDAIANVVPEINGKDIHLITDFAAASATVLGDAVRLQQVFWNILRNGAKFTPQNGAVTVRTLLSADLRYIEIRISDTGMGMNPDEVGRLFNAFTQGEHARSEGSHRFGGLGLGLAISRMLVELHSGRIWGASEGEGCGATFTVQLPLAVHVSNGKVPNEDTVISKPTVKATSRPCRILLVEDHEPTRASLAQLLARRHYEVSEAATVADAIAEAATHKFDLLVTDIGLPDGDGYQLMRTLRQHYAIRGIALTGYGMKEDIERSMLAGFTTHLTKPIRIQALDDALASAAAVPAE